MTTSIEDLCTLLESQNFTGLAGAYAFYIPGTAAKGSNNLEIKRTGGDRYDDLTPGNDNSLGSTDVLIDTVCPDPLDAVTIAQEVSDFLCSYSGTMGTRTLWGSLVGMPEDDLDAPQDGSDNWVPRVHLSVTIQHSPA